MNKEKVNKLAKQIHETAVDKGWWDGERNTQEVFMLIITELAEAIEADREGRRASVEEFKKLLDDLEMDEGSFKQFFHLHMKDTVEDELADTYIRCLDWLYFDNEEVDIRTVDISWRPNFAENIFFLCKIVSNEDIRTVAGIIPSLAKHLGIDFEFHVKMKMRFNGIREKMHGGKKY